MHDALFNTIAWLAGDPNVCTRNEAAVPKRIGIEADMGSLTNGLPVAYTQLHPCRRVSQAPPQIALIRATRESCNHTYKTTRHTASLSLLQRFLFLLLPRVRRTEPRCDAELSKNSSALIHQLSGCSKLNNYSTVKHHDLKHKSKQYMGTIQFTMYFNPQRLPCHSP